MLTGYGAVLGNWQSGQRVSCCSHAGLIGSHSGKWNSEGWTRGGKVAYSPFWNRKTIAEVGTFMCSLRSILCCSRSTYHEQTQATGGLTLLLFKGWGEPYS